MRPTTVRLPILDCPKRDMYWDFFPSAPSRQAIVSDDVKVKSADPVSWLSNVTLFVKELRRSRSEAVELLSSDSIAYAIDFIASCFALPGDFSPLAAVILNLSPDHLARHGDMAGYARAKARIFDGLRPESLAGMPHQEDLKVAAKDKPGRRVWLDDVDVDQPVLDSLCVLGAHNRWNAAVAMLLAAQVGVVPQDLSALQGLPHRLEPVLSRDQRIWINDSKATNVEAAQVGISALEGPGVVLLGGQGKGGADYGMLKSAISGRPLICFGQAGPEIHAVLGGELVATMEQAVARAQQLSVPGESVLLSPACSSFDAFDNFEQRGQIFARLVQELS